MAALLRCAAAVAVALLLAAAGDVRASTPGTFVGTLAEEPENSGSYTWIYVQGRNGWVRRVESSRARVVYGPAVPSSRRASDPRQSLVSGVEVRVTASQDGEGEWHAQRIEVLRLAPGRGAQRVAYPLP